MRTYDVAVVGAGPGGAMAAEAAAAEGASVVLIDRRREVGVPVVCGELTSFGTFGEFSMDPEAPWVGSVMDRIEFVFPGDRSLFVNGVRLATIYRDRFEKHLVERAVEKGTELRLGTTARAAVDDGVMLKGGRKIPARIVIAADGVKSTIGKSMGMTSALPRADLGRASKYMVEHPDINGGISRFFVGENGVLGYGWILPKEDGLANVGIGTLGNARGAMKPLLDRFIRERLPGARKWDYAAGCLPLGLPPPRTVWRNVMLVGDAACMVNSVGGAGIRSAMIAGRFAGRLAGKASVEKLPLSCLEGYEKLWRKKLEKRLCLNYHVKSLMWRSPGTVDSLYNVMAPLFCLASMAPGFLMWLQERQHM